MSGDGLGAVMATCGNAGMMNFIRMSLVVVQRSILELYNNVHSLYFTDRESRTLKEFYGVR